jgi:DNA-binding XRE family transcriptional regulator
MNATERKSYIAQATSVFGKNMGAVRRNMGYTQQDMSERIPCDKNMISQWETGERLPMPYYMLRVSNVLGVSLDYLFGMTTDVEIDQNAALYGACMMQFQTMFSTVQKTLAKGFVQKINSVLPSNETYLLIEAALNVINAAEGLNGVSPEVIALKKATQNLRLVRNRVVGRVDQINKMVDRSVSDAVAHDDSSIGHLLLWEQTEKVRG